MRILNIIILSLFSLFSLAKTDTERLYVQTDKAFYLAGEEMKLKVYDVDDAFRLQQLSGVCYVELVDKQLSHVLGKIHLRGGAGHASLEIPFSTPTGEYELVAYTRWMRNEGSHVFFRKPIAVFNALLENHDDRLKIEPPASSIPIATINNFSLSTDKETYSPREAVGVTLDKIPEGVELAVSVARIDVPYSDYSIFDFKASRAKPAPFTPQLLPELDCMIIDALGSPTAMNPNLTVRGRDIAYYAAQPLGNGHYSFHTPFLFGTQRVATGIERGASGESLQLLSPFIAKSEQTDDTLRLTPEWRQALLERSIALQVGSFYNPDTLRRPRLSEEIRFPIAPAVVFDLDEYVRFSTVKECIIEFISSAITVGSKANERIHVFNNDEQSFMPEPALVLIDGVAVMNHDDALKYNPHLLKFIEVYKGFYLFGNHVYNGIFSLKTYDGESLTFAMPANSMETEFQGLEQADEPVTGNPQPLRNLPDCRHTLYWNPNLSPDCRQLSFHASDLCGTFLITVEGIGPKGEIIRGTTTFNVKQQPQ